MIGRIVVTSRKGVARKTIVARGLVAADRVRAEEDPGAAGSEELPVEPASERIVVRGGTGTGARSGPIASRDDTAHGADARLVRLRATGAPSPRPPMA